MLGCVLLALICGVTFTLGLLVFVIDDACSAADFTDGPIHCRNAGTARQILMITPVVAGPVAVVLTWFPPTRARRPRTWLPFAGIGVLAAAWFVVSEWVPVF